MGKKNPFVTNFMNRLPFVQAEYQQGELCADS